MDLAEFFPSITQVDVGKYIVDHPVFFAAWTPADIDVFCSIVCGNSALTIGAPTSPALSNALCYEMDSDLAALSARNDVLYSRYADDLFFSTDHPGTLKTLEAEGAKAIAHLDVPANLRVNTKKTRHSSKRRARRVTGIVIGSDGSTYIGRHYKRRIRALIHKIDSLDAAARTSLAGTIALCDRV